MVISSNSNIQPGKTAEASGDLLQALASGEQLTEKTAEGEQFAQLLNSEVENSETEGEVKIFDGKTSEEAKQDKGVNPELAALSGVKNTDTSKKIPTDQGKQPLPIAQQAQVTEKPVKSIFMSKEQIAEAEAAKKGHVAEIPEGRKSIFAVPGRVNPRMAARDAALAGKIDTKAAVTEQAAALNKMEASQFQSSADVLNLRDFMQNKSQVANAAGGNVYKSQAPASMFTRPEAAGAPKVAINSINSNAEMNALGMGLASEVEQVDRNLAMQSQGKQMGGNELGGSKQVFDLNGLSTQSDSAQMIDQIKNYIIQSKVSSNPNVEMSFTHEELGKVDLFVKKTEGDHVSITIATSTNDAAKFFGKNQGDLLSSLASSGVKVSDFKLDNSSLNSSSDNLAGQGRGEGGQAPHDQRKQDSERRKELWDQMINKEAA